MDPDAFTFHKVPDIPANRFQGYLLISDQVDRGEIELVWRELDSVLEAGVPGAIVEFGCYAGTTSLFIRRLLDKRHESSARPFHVYDSFEGLPEKTPKDQSAAGTAFTAGKLSVSKKEFLHQFHAAHLQPPTIHKGWFEQLRQPDIPPQIAFAFLDGDFYSSILTSLKLVWPQLQPGGTILIDDYAQPKLPGAERAVRDFFLHKPQPTIRVERSMAIIRR